MNNEEAQSNTVTLFGGRSISVQHADGSAEIVTVRQLPLRDYEQAFRLADDEQGLVALICGKTKDWLLGAAPAFNGAVTPESYEELLATAQEVNAKGFFAFAERRQAQLAKRLSSMPPEMLKAAAQAATSSTSQPRLRPVAG